MNNLLNNLTETAECWLYSFIGVGVVALLAIIGVFYYKKIKSPCSKNQSDDGESLQALKREIAQYIPIVTKLCDALQEFGEDEQRDDYSKYDTDDVKGANISLRSCMGKDDKYCIVGRIYCFSFSKFLSAEDQRELYSVDENGVSNSRCTMEQIAEKYFHEEILKYGYIKPVILEDKHLEILSVCDVVKGNKFVIEVGIEPKNNWHKRIILKDLSRKDYDCEGNYCKDVHSTVEVLLVNNNYGVIIITIGGKERCIKVPKERLVFSKDGYVTRDSVYKVIAEALSSLYPFLKYFAPCAEKNEEDTSSSKTTNKEDKSSDSEQSGEEETRSDEKGKGHLDIQSILDTLAAEASAIKKKRKSEWVEEDETQIFLDEKELKVSIIPESYIAYKAIRFPLDEKTAMRLYKSSFKEKADFYKGELLNNSMFGIENAKKILSLYFAGFPVWKIEERFCITNAEISTLRAIYGFGIRYIAVISDIDVETKEKIKQGYADGSSIEELHKTSGLPYPKIFKILYSDIKADEHLPEEVFTDFLPKQN